MTEPSRGSAYENVIRASKPQRIGKHEWCLVRYCGTEQRFVGDKTVGKGRYVVTPTVFIDYQRRRLGEPFEYRRQAREWRSYDFNSGQTRGLPITLRELSEATLLPSVQRGLAWHVDGCPLPARVWKGNAYASLVDDCIGCEHMLAASGGVGVICDGFRALRRPRPAAVKSLPPAMGGVRTSRGG